MMEILFLFGFTILGIGLFMLLIQGIHLLIEELGSKRVFMDFIVQIILMNLVIAFAIALLICVWIKVFNSLGA